MWPFTNSNIGRLSESDLSAFFKALEKTADDVALIKEKISVFNNLRDKIIRNFKIRKLNHEELDNLEALLAEILDLVDGITLKLDESADSFEIKIDKLVEDVRKLKEISLDNERKAA